MPSRDIKLARQAMKTLADNPDDTAQAIVVIAAMAGNSNDRLFARFKKSPAGGRILQERRDIGRLLCDRERLLALPEGTLGRTICEWFIKEGISAEGLVGASEEASEQFPDRAMNDSEASKLFGSRLLALHDVFHVLTGYDRDMRGEMGVLAFTIPQTWNTGIAYLVWRALGRNGWFSEPGRLIRQGFWRGLRAKWLLDQDWEALFELPIDVARERLGVGAPPVYEQLRSAQAPPLSA
ncbi:MAG: Coq4 family protein [Myxococcota bacterium]|jgi:ubiquinone biosynthesis protein COQ4|nr:Coq4 family protein [Myxococcota bacterium]